MNKVSEARENTCDQDALGVSFASDWLREALQSEVKPNCCNPDRFRYLKEIYSSQKESSFEDRNTTLQHTLCDSTYFP